MRLFLVLIPVALIGGFAIHQATSGSSTPSEGLTIAVEAPAIADIPAKAEIPAIPAVAVHVAPHAEVSVRIPRQAILEAEQLANEIRLHAEATAHADNHNSPCTLSLYRLSRALPSLHGPSGNPSPPLGLPSSDRETKGTGHPLAGL